MCSIHKFIIGRIVSLARGTGLGAGFGVVERNKNNMWMEHIDTAPLL